MIPTPDRVTLGCRHWLVWVAVSIGVRWDWRGARGPTEPKELALVMVPR